MKQSPPLAFELMAALHAIEARLEAALAPRGLSLAKFGALSQLVAAGEPLPLSTLAARCACVRSNITQLIDRLEGDKLVVRAVDPKDRRSVRARLTSEGRSRHAAGAEALQNVEASILASLTDEQRHVLVPILRSLGAER
jgi:DNA-binding MarR family transcriptional regulator